jgi:hypothetical protein
MLENIRTTELFFQYLKKYNGNSVENEDKDTVLSPKMKHLLLTNLRMTICELG